MRPSSDDVRHAGVWTAQMRIDTPLGGMLLARTLRGLGGAWFDAQKHHPEPLAAPWHLASSSLDPVLNRAAEQLQAYFLGQRMRFDLALDPRGTPFQQQVWRALLEIPAGQTRSYGDIAQALGRPSAVRAVGGAVARNPISVIVPCHRVLGQAGTLTGYAGGVERKQALLELEGAWPSRTSSG